MAMQLEHPLVDVGAKFEGAVPGDHEEHRAAANPVDLEPLFACGAWLPACPDDVAALLAVRLVGDRQEVQQPLTVGLHLARLRSDVVVVSVLCGATKQKPTEDGT